MQSAISRTRVTTLPNIIARLSSSKKDKTVRSLFNGHFRTVHRRQCPGASALRWYSTTHSGPLNAVEDDFLSSMMDDLTMEAAQIQRARSMPTEADLHQMIREMIPAESYSYEVFNALCTYFQTTKVDHFIPCPKVQITVVEQSDGTEQRSEFKEVMDITRGLRLAKSLNKNLVMMGENRGVAYCKVRDEKKRALLSVQQLMERAQLANQSKRPIPTRGDTKRGTKERPPVEYEFRDAMDEHAVGWRSRKIVDDLSRGRTVRIVINRFVSPDTAVAKFQELFFAVKNEAEGRAPNVVGHSVNTIRASENEISALVVPNSDGSPNKVTHPGEKDWERHRTKMWTSVERSGRESPGTYRKSESKRKRMSLGIRQGRVNAFGDEIEE